jgi:ankyrin
VLLLLSNGATRDAATKDNYTPLHIAVKEGHEDVVEILLDNGAKHDITTKVLIPDVCSS